jgi:pimeloyl-ACP methyl ester carboxylesterase
MQPTLVLCGRDDDWSPPAQHEAMQAAIPNASLSIVEHCGHMCTMEQPQALNDALAAWLRR